MKRLGWKLFTAYDAYRVAGSCYYHMQSNPLPVSWLLFVVLPAAGTLGLVGYSWQLKIGNAGCG